MNKKIFLLDKSSLLFISLASVLFLSSFLIFNLAHGSAPAFPSGTSGSGGQAPASESTYNQTIKINNPLKSNDISELINRIVNWLLVIGAPILALMIIIGAFQILTAAGNAEQVTLGRKTITYAVVGYILLLISTGITKIIADLFGTK